MKKILAGKKYDTDTAQLLGSWWDGLSVRDFNHTREKLYRTKAGKYFIHGEGGPMSRYSVSCGQNEWSGGENIEPVSRETAMKWAEDHLEADEYEKIFGTVPEGEETETLYLNIDAALKAALKTEAETRGMNLTTLAIEKLKKDGLQPMGIQEIAARIRESSRKPRPEWLPARDIWNIDDCVELCKLAGMSEEWRTAGLNFEAVVLAAAEKLGVKIT